MAALAVAGHIAALYDSELRVVGCTGDAEQLLAAGDQVGGLECLER